GTRCLQHDLAGEGIENVRGIAGIIDQGGKNDVACVKIVFAIRNLGDISRDRASLWSRADIADKHQPDFCVSIDGSGVYFLIVPVGLNLVVVVPVFVPAIQLLLPCRIMYGLPNTFSAFFGSTGMSKNFGWPFVPILTGWPFSSRL